MLIINTLIIVYLLICILKFIVINNDFWYIGRLAQLVEHLVYTERVIGSSPLPPTILSFLMKSVFDFIFTHVKYC